MRNSFEIFSGRISGVNLNILGPLHTADNLPCLSKLKEADFLKIIILHCNIPYVMFILFAVKCRFFCKLLQCPSVFQIVIFFLQFTLYRLFNVVLSSFSLTVSVINHRRSLKRTALQRFKLICTEISFSFTESSHGSNGHSQLLLSGITLAFRLTKTCHVSSILQTSFAHLLQAFGQNFDLSFHQYVEVSSKVSSLSVLLWH